MTTFRQNVRPLSIIVAVDEEGGFAKEGKIPWSVPEDMKHFKKITNKHPCIMGRRTYEDMLKMRKERDKKAKRKNKLIGEILPGRKAIVLTTDKDYKAPGATVASGLTPAIQELKEGEEVFVLGGYRLFIEALNWADKIYMSVIKGRFDCDRFFPLQLLNKHYRIADGEKTDNAYFVTYRRVGKV